MSFENGDAWNPDCIPIELNSVNPLCQIRFIDLKIDLSL